MSFEMRVGQILKGPHPTRIKWKTLKPDIGYQGQPYRWTTKEKAQRMIDIMYPDVSKELKQVIEVKAKPNIGNEKDVTKYNKTPLFGWERK